jgi:hypothetical protein
MPRDRFLSFDVETTGLIGKGLPLPELLCAAAVVVEFDADGWVLCSHRPMTWPPVPNDSDDIGDDDGPPARAMNESEVLDLVDYMWSVCGDAEDAMRVLAWNGVGYDMRLLHMHCTRFDTSRGDVAANRIREMTLSSCDPMLNFTYRKGFPVKLSAAADVMSTPMAKNGEGAECADMWLTGDKQARIDVLRYCANDVVMTAAVFVEMQRTGALKWRTRRGNLSEWRPPRGSGELTAPCSEVVSWAFENNDFMRTVNNKIDYAVSVPCPEEFVGWLQIGLKEGRPHAKRARLM